MMDDDNNKYKSKYSSLKKDNIKCNNLNFNLNALDVDAIPEPLRSLLASQAQAAEEGAEIGSGTYGNGEERFVGYNDKDFEFVCVNNNDNQFIVSPTPPTPPPPPIPPVNIVCTVWTDNTPGNFDIFFARSTDGGLTFSEPENK